MGMKERETVMKLRTFYLIALLVALVIFTVLATIFFVSDSHTDRIVGTSVFGMFGVFGMFAIMCALGLRANHVMEIEEAKDTLRTEHNRENNRHAACDREIASQHAKVVEQFGIEREVLMGGHTRLAASLACVAREIYETRSPTDADMRTIRRKLVMCVIDTLYAGVLVTIVARQFASPDVIRDVVETMLKDGHFDLKDGPEWQRELVQYVLTGKAAPWPD